MKYKSLLVLVAAPILASFVPAPAEAQNTARVPFLVLTDNLGIPIGPVVSFDSGRGIPIVRIEDPDENIPVFLEILDSATMAGSMSTTFFDNADCTGNVYHSTTFTLNDQGMAELTGFIHSVARPGGTGDQRLYRSDLSQTGTSIAVGSRFSDSGCEQVTMDTVDVRPATDVMNLDMAFPPPYAAQ